MFVICETSEDNMQEKLPPIFFRYQIYPRKTTFKTTQQDHFFLSQQDPLWDKISQNLAQLEAISHKIFKSHRIFRPCYNILYGEININHTLLSLLQASYI